MLAVLRQLITPLDYIKIKSAGSEKVLLDIYFPLIFAIISCVGMSAYPSVVPMLGDHGFVANLNGLLQTLTGFYVGALAAVATFPNPTMDQKTDNLFLDGDLVVRRLFIAKLFAYLAFVAFALYLVGLFVSLPSYVLHGIGNPLLKKWVRVAGVFIYLFAFWQMLTVTLLGLYYLCDRIHRKVQN